MKKESLKIIEWLQNHPLIMITGIAKSLKINRGNFSTYIKKNKSIPDAYIKNVVNLLKEYGYKGEDNPPEILAEKNTAIILKSLDLPSLDLPSLDIPSIPAPKNKFAYLTPKKQISSNGEDKIKPDDKITPIQKERKQIPDGLDKIGTMRWLRENN